jgi:hypothetical protein
MADKDTVRVIAENDLEAFIKLVHPKRVLGGVHSELIQWLTRKDKKSHQLVLLPRDHQKSAIAAYWVAWHITRNPAVRILYISSTSNLAVKQLKFIKDILTSDIYRFYWPEMVNKDEAKREKWTETEISVDHPLRKLENVRDPTVFAAGLTTNVVGLHCDKAVLDDVVVDETAYTEEGREKTRSQYSLLSSIEGTEADELTVGTSYDPNDLYDDQINMEIELYNDEGELISSEPLYEVFERQVEDRGDGTGQFLWPKQMRSDGKYFGFDEKILARKKAQYLNKSKFYAQYYNDPNAIQDGAIKPEYFQYFERAHVYRAEGRWYYRGTRLNVFASIDFAYSTSKGADYTSIVVVGVDAQNNIYVLDIDRFKTGDISEYFRHILAMHRKWDFRKLRAEITAAQEAIVKELKTAYIRPYGLSLSIDENRPTRSQGTKEERIAATLNHKYQNLQMWHYQGGNCQILEEELVLARPAHDDVKDALAAVCEITIPPSSGFGGRLPHEQLQTKTAAFVAENTHKRFGGIL